MKNICFSLDSYDLQIIKQLMTQGRTTWAELGAILGLSAPAAADRVRRLEERRIIKGYTALLNPEAVGCGVTAFILVTLEHPRYRCPFLEKIQEMREIQECHHIAGEGDYLLKVRCFSLSCLEVVVSEQIKGMPGVFKTSTTIVLSTIKETPHLPLDCQEE